MFFIENKRWFEAIKLSRKPETNSKRTMILYLESQFYHTENMSEILDNPSDEHLMRTANRQ